MSQIELTEQFLAKIAGWEVVKQARALLERGQVLSSNWSPPILKGVVQEGSISYRAGLAIKGTIDIDNMCGCRASRQWGTICAHSVGVGLHHLRRANLPALPTSAGASQGQAAQAGPRPNTPSASKPPKQLRRAGPSERGESLELKVIFPPNFAQAALKGKIMLCFEGQWARGRSPVNALPMNTPFTVSSQDNAILEAIEQLAEGESPGMLMLSSEAFTDLLPKLADHPGLSLGRSQSLTVSTAPWPVPLRAKLEASGEIQLSMPSGQVLPTIIPGKTAWVFLGQTLQPLRLSRDTLEVLRAPIKIPRARIPQFLGQDWPALRETGAVEANFTPDDFTFEPQPPRFHLHLNGGLAQLEARLQCAYGPRVMTLGVTAKEESLWLPDPDCPTRYSTRDLASEQAALARLQRYGFAGPDSQGRLQLLGQNAVLNFFAREFPRLEKEWSVTLEERLEKSAAKNLERVEPRFEITPSGEQWFDLNVSYTSSSGRRFSPGEIQRLLLSGQSHTRLPDGRIALMDTGAVEELQEVLLDCGPRQSNQLYRIHNAQAGFLASALEQQSGWAVQAPAGWRRQIARQTGQAKLEPPPLGELEEVLRPYQKTGVAWLHFLRQNQFGGILADEMGLGKTLQTLAFLQTVRQEPAGGPRAGSTDGAALPCLIVCPTTLVHNWVAEVKKFTPNLRVLPLHGPQRHAQFSRIAEAGLIVTSYSLIRRDAEVYRDLEFDTLVLDEAQHIKNRQTQNAQAVKNIRSRHRLVLTGTPLENSVLDLWSIFDFLMPGYLGAPKDFKERYEIPIAREKDTQTRKRLARRIRPFLLRRLKRDVAKELPAKIEQVSFCELTDPQREVYRQILEASRAEIVNAVDGQGLQKSRMLILSALLRLRQTCCDLRLLKLETETESPSGKLDLFSELMEEVLDGGHRVLVFSQFVSMLTLLRQKLESEQIDYCYLDGSTGDRAKVVERFQSKPEIPVFLISLKAGGVGLNLTGADTVIHFDPWWNPAVEDQATDRAHRIGQSRVVTSYKLITRGTVEEKILNLQARKRAVIDGTIGGEEQLAESLNWEEIQELLAE